MTVYYVGPGGNNANSGLTWATRKLTLNGAEDVPVAPGDTVYIGPGTYREQLNLDVSGTNGNPITYVGDVTGEHTDGVGGIVRLTGSDDDLTAARSYVIISSGARSYRTFRGLRFDGSSNTPLETGANTVSNWIIEDCVFDQHNAGATIYHIGIRLGSTNMTVRRCHFRCRTGSGGAIRIEANTAVDNAGILIENCIFDQGNIFISIVRYGGVTVRNCRFFASRGAAVRVETSPNAGQAAYVYNCEFRGCEVGVQSTAVDFLVEDYNNFWSTTTLRSSVNVGVNSVAVYPFRQDFLLLKGYQFLTNPTNFLSFVSLNARTDNGSAPTDDFYGIPRPGTNGKRSWGPIQYQPIERATNVTYGTSPSSLKMLDFARHQMFLPVSNVSTTITVRVYREADYAGTLPQLVIKQPGQADQTVTDTGAAGQWNTLTITLTPVALPPYVVVELASNNTATAGSYAVYWDDIQVS